MAIQIVYLIVSSVVSVFFAVLIGLFFIKDIGGGRNHAPAPRTELWRQEEEEKRSGKEGR